MVLTPYDGDENIYRALDAGARGYLLKDMLRTEMLTGDNSPHMTLAEVYEPPLDPGGTRGVACVRPVSFRW